MLIPFPPLFGGRGAAVQRPVGQAGQLPGGGQPVAGLGRGEPGGGLAALSARGVGGRRAATAEGEGAARGGFLAKPQIALEQIAALAADPVVPRGVVLADAGYGNNTAFRQGVEDLGLSYEAGIVSSTSVWAPGMAPLPPAPNTGGLGRPAKRLRRGRDHAPLSVKGLAESLARALAADRMARRRGRAEQVLALQPARGHQPRAAGLSGQAALADRARLPRAQAGAGPR